jgi:hypothetical protein
MKGDRLEILSFAVSTKGVRIAPHPKAKEFVIVGLFVNI